MPLRVFERMLFAGLVMSTNCWMVRSLVNTCMGSHTHSKLQVRSHIVHLVASYHATQMVHGAEHDAHTNTLSCNTAVPPRLFPYMHRELTGESVQFCSLYLLLCAPFLPATTAGMCERWGPLLHLFVLVIFHAHTTKLAPVEAQYFQNVNKIPAKQCRSSPKHCFSGSPKTAGGTQTRPFHQFVAEEGMRRRGGDNIERETGGG